MLKIPRNSHWDFSNQLFWKIPGSVDMNL